MSHKSSRIAEMIRDFQGADLPAHYLGYIACFNKQLFYEAHDVLEDLWLGQKHGPEGAFYKGLIQLAGAFVHLQKGRLQPAVSLFKLARSNLQGYQKVHLRMDMSVVIGMANKWLTKLEKSNSQANPLASDSPPELKLLPPS